MEKSKSRLLLENLENSETIRNERNIYEQKPVNVDDFNEVEEKDMKEKVEKQKQERREVAEKNKLLKERENWKKIK